MLLNTFVIEVLRSQPASELSIWGNRKKSRESSPPKRTRVRRAGIVHKLEHSRLRAVSLFSWSVEQNARDTQMTTRVTEGAALVSRVSRLRR